MKETPTVTRALSKIFWPANLSECWMWTGAVSGGYGYIGVHRTRTTRKAATVLYEFFLGPVPAGLELDHLCRVRLCVNPWHLEPVTKRENILRGTSPSATHSKKIGCPKCGGPYTQYKDKRRCQPCTKARKHVAYTRRRYAAS